MGLAACLLRVLHKLCNPERRDPSGDGSHAPHPTSSRYVPTFAFSVRSEPAQARAPARDLRSHICLGLWRHDESPICRRAGPPSTVRVVLESKLLRDAVLSAVPASERERLAAVADWSGELERAVECARSKLGFALDPCAFGTHLVELLRNADHPLDEGLTKLDLEGVYLALGCARGDKRALAAFERRFAADIERAGQRLRGTAMTMDEHRQRVRERLFVPKGQRAPKIATYTGRGSLRSWVRTIAVRSMIDAARSPAARVSSELVGEKRVQWLPERDDAELAWIRAEERDRIQAALRGAFADLSPRERNLLRQRFFFHLGPKALATIYRVHRATITRWFERLHARLLDTAKARLKADSVGGDIDLEQILVGLRSHTDLSIRRLLHSTLEPEERAS